MQIMKNAQKWVLHFQVVHFHLCALECYEELYLNCLNKSYPLARVLYIYVNKKPGKELEKLPKEFIKFILSKEGQEIVAKDGYYPLPAKICDKFIKSL